MPEPSAVRLVTAAGELEDALVVGHKFARQARLRRAGFAVPPFVCVPVSAYDAALAQALGSLGGMLATASPGAAGGPGRTARAAALRDRIKAVGPPPELLDGLAGWFAALAGPAGVVAVRACVVPTPDGQGEDTADDPHAGLSDSFLYVRGDDLARRIADCWASAFNPGAMLYRARRGEDPWGARVAVGVQRMVMGTRSFVAFTRDPRDGHSRCVIAAAHGIGEGVVQEKADIDHFMVDSVTGEIDRRIAHKTRAVGLDPARPECGVVPLPVSPDAADVPVLADGELGAIAALAARVEALFGDPQDIEGTVTDDGRIHLVQARPIVAAAAPGPPAAPGIPWGSSNVTESFPGVSCALTFSVAADLYRAGFADAYRRLGVSRRALRDNQHRLGRMIGYLDGRIYYRLDSWYHLHGLIRCFRPLWPTWEQAIGLRRTDGADAAVRRRPGRLRTAVHVTEMLARAAIHPIRVRRFLTWWDGYHPRLDEVAGWPPAELVDAYRRLFAQYAARWGTTLANGLFLMGTTWAAGSLLRRWAPGADRSVLNGMLCGGPQNRSAAALRSVIALAETVRAQPALHHAVHDDATDPAARWAELTSGRYGEQVAGQLREHLRRYGDRALHDLKLEAATPRMRPWTLLDTVGAYADQDLTVEASRAAELRVRYQAERELRARCRGPLRRACLRVLFGVMRWLMRVREDTRFCRSQLVGDMRALLLRLGTELAAAQRLDRPRDVLDLTVQEVLGAFEGTLPGAELRGLAAVRAAERERWAAGPARPARIDTDPRLPLATALARRAAQQAPQQTPQHGDHRGGTLLTGLASSSGVVRGRAKVVLDASITASECRDRILVARETDPGWLFLMMSAKALVVERGTLLSHTAITGRLLGIPTVVAVDDATSLIGDGCVIEVDGDAGTVRLEPAPEAAA
jgi:pyruvate,water dikinase